MTTEITHHEDHRERWATAETKNWALTIAIGALWVISTAAIGIIFNGQTDRLRRLEDTVADRGIAIASLQVEVRAAKETSDLILPKLDKLALDLATLSGKVDGLREARDRDERRARP